MSACVCACARARALANARVNVHMCLLLNKFNFFFLNTAAMQHMYTWVCNVTHVLHNECHHDDNGLGLRSVINRIAFKQMK